MGARMCTCGSRKNWRVLKRNYRQSAFDGYERRSSEYSSVICLKCSSVCFRTKAKYVAFLEDYKGELDNYNE